MPERIGTITSYFEGPRWAAFPSYIKTTCHMLGLKLDMEVDKGFLRETVRFKVVGPESALRQFNAQLEADVTDYNKN